MDVQVQHLENAIKDIDQVKRKLHQNTAEVKSLVQTEISRNLEALRNREVWLLTQVELLQSAKEEVLNNQQSRLSKLLGSVQGRNVDGLTRVQRHQVDLYDLKPEETPFMTFRVDSGSLRDSINNFGRIDVNGLPNLAFVQADNPSTSLPRQVEEYEDADHHMLYKTVEEIKQSKSADSPIDVRFPKLSPSFEHWLARPATTTKSYQTDPKFSMPTFSQHAGDWLKLSSDKASSITDSGSVCSTTSSQSSIMSGSIASSAYSVPSFSPFKTSASTQNWLKQIKHDFEDEDDFEIVEKGGSCGSPDTEFHRDFVIPSSHSAPNLQEWKYKPSSTVWLKSGELTKKRNQDSITETTHDVFKHYFATIARDDKQWIASSACNVKAVDIENLGYFVSQNNSCGTEGNGCCIGHDNPKVNDFTWLCKASEPCKEMKECAKEPSCMEQFLQRNPSCKLKSMNVPGFKMQECHTGPIDTNTWLLKDDKGKPIPTAKNVFIEHFETTSKSLSDWLKAEKPFKRERSPRTQSGQCTMISFDHIDTNMSNWIKSAEEERKKSESVRISESIVSEDRNPWLLQTTEDTNKWLAKPSDSTEKMDDRFVYNHDTDKWIMK